METGDSLLSRSVRDYLIRLASSAPAPGGGSAAALTGALAAALGQMVCALTIGKPKFAAFEVELRELAERLERARIAFERLVDEDAAAYGALASAFKVARDNPLRRSEIESTALTAASVPLETAVLAHGLESELARLRQVGNLNLVADMDAGSALMRATREAAVANVRANLPLLSEEWRGRMDRELARLARDANKI